jgi:hypothetical protein
MFCTSCGADLGSRFFKFCQHCGAPLQVLGREPETAAAPPPVGAQPREEPSENAFPALSSITLDGISALEFAPPTPRPAATAAPQENEPSKAETAPLPWRELRQPEGARKYRNKTRRDAKKPRGNAEPAQTAQTPGLEETAANLCPELTRAAELAALPPEAELGYCTTGAEPAPPTVIPAPLSTEGAPAAPAGWEKKRYAPEISAITSTAGWGRIEPTMSGARNLPPPIAPRPIRTSAGFPLAAPGIAAVLILALAGGWWFFDRIETTPEAFREDAPEISSGTLPSTEEREALASGTPAGTLPAETQPATTQAVPKREELPSDVGPEPVPAPEASLMSIPSLPSNQQQGNHNRSGGLIEPLPELPPASTSSALVPPASVSNTPYPPPVESVTPPPSSRRPPALQSIPLPMPPAPEDSMDTAPRREPAHAAEPEWEPPRPDVELEWELLRPATKPEREPPRPAAPAPAARERSDSPPWRNRLRRELSNCEDFFCRERVREQYCSERWKALPECRGAPL